MSSGEPKQIRQGDWYTVRQIFGGPFWFDDPKSGTPCAQKFGVNVGVQVLTAMDAAGQSILHARPVQKTPSPFTAAEVLGFLGEVFEQHGLPRVGVLVSKSVWQSSTEMTLDDQLAERAEFLRKLSIDLDPMDTREKDRLCAALGKLGLRVAFSEDKLS